MPEKSNSAHVTPARTLCQGHCVDLTAFWTDRTDRYHVNMDGASDVDGTLDRTDITRAHKIVDHSGAVARKCGPKGYHNNIRLSPRRPPRLRRAGAAGVG